MMMTRHDGDVVLLSIKHFATSFDRQNSGKFIRGIIRLNFHQFCMFIKFLDPTLAITPEMT